MDIVEYTVSEISFAVKRCVETTFSAVRVKGEVFGAKRADEETIARGVDRMIRIAVTAIRRVWQEKR